MKVISTAFCLAAICAVGLGAQSGTTETKTKTKIDVKDGKDVTISGCLAANPGGGYMLTTTSGDHEIRAGHGRRLCRSTLDIGWRSRARRRIAATARSRSNRRPARAAARKKRVTTEMKGDMPGMHYLGVKSVKMISKSCM